MNSFTPEYLENRLIISPEILRTISQIREFKGKQDLYLQRKPEILENLRQVSFIH